MSIFHKLIGFVGSGAGTKIVDATAAHFPTAMSPGEREQLKVELASAIRTYELELLRLTQQEQELVAARMRDLEGTSSDLTSAGFPGKMLLFLRGAQRPVWGFAVMYMDFMVFSGVWHLAPAPTSGPGPNFTPPLDLQSAFWVINFLVLGFLFGERAMRNVMPFFQNRRADSLGAAKGREAVG